MRHLLSLIAGVVVAPLAWALLAMGQSGTADTVAAWTEDNAFDTADLIVPGAYLAGAGILLGLIATLRISPLGALVAALGYLGLNAGLFVDPFAVRDAVPNNWSIAGEAIPLRTPLLNGTLLAAGALLLIAVFSAKRWQRWPVAVPAGEVPAEPEVPTEPVEHPPAEPATVGVPSAQPPANSTSEPTRQATAEQPAAAPGGPPAPGVAWPPPAQAEAGQRETGPSGPPPPRHAADNEIPPSSPPGDTPGSPWAGPPRSPE